MFPCDWLGWTFWSFTFINLEVGYSWRGWSLPWRTTLGDLVCLWEALHNTCPGFFCCFWWNCFGEFGCKVFEWCPNSWGKVVSFCFANAVLILCSSYRLVFLFMIVIFCLYTADLLKAPVTLNNQLCNLLLYTLSYIFLYRMSGLKIYNRHCFYLYGRYLISLLIV